MVKFIYIQMRFLLIRIGDRTVEGVAEIIKFLHAVFYGKNEIEEYIDFSKNEQFRKELKTMGIMGDHLIQLGEERQLEKVKEAESRASEAEARAKAAEKRAESAEERIEQLEKQMKELMGQLSVKEK